MPEPIRVSSHFVTAPETGHILGVPSSRVRQLIGIAELPSQGYSLHVADAVRFLRQQRGLSQRELALRMAVPRTYISKIENEQATPTLSSLERLAKALGVSVPDLLTRSTSVPASLTKDLTRIANEPQAIHHVARAILSLRQRLGLNQRELALRMAVPRTIVSKVENGQTVPSLSLIERFANALGVSMSDLLASVPASLTKDSTRIASAQQAIHNVAGAIRSLRQRRSLSQRELALRMAIPRTLMSKIEKEQIVPSLSLIERFANALGVSLLDLIGGKVPASGLKGPRPQTVRTTRSGGVSVRSHAEKKTIHRKKTRDAHATGKGN